jgi:hypothetical protein
MGECLPSGLDEAMRRFFPIVFVVVLFALGGALRASGQAALLMEEPFGKFGRFNPTGHAAIYLPRVCTVTPVMLRRCDPGELGVVISAITASMAMTGLRCRWCHISTR